jgi:hypothetical protein
MVDGDVGSGAVDGLVGNRLALVGAGIYLLEWVAILASPPPGPVGPGTSAAQIEASYAGHAGPAGFAAAWFAVVLVGRILYVAAVKASLRGSPRELPLLDLAVGAMVASVVLEITSYGMVAAAARLATDRAAESVVVVGLDGAAYWIDLLIWGPIGVSVVAAGLAMLRSRAFSFWLCWLAVGAGSVGILGCLLSGASAGRSWAGVADAVTGLAALGMWVWMLSTGVVLFRRGKNVSAVTG